MTETSSDAERVTFDALAFMKLAGRIGHTRSLGLRYLAHGDDWAELMLPYSPSIVGVTETGVLASAPIISIMDMAMSVAVWCKIGGFRPQATLDMRVDYLRPATAGQKVYGRGECYHATRTIAFAGGVAHDGDPADPIARVAANFMATDKW